MTPVPLDQLVGAGSTATGVALPGYDRATITTGIVHFGFGNFHRAHQAMYLDQLMRRGEALDWGICGVGLLPGDARMRDAMAGQGCLYTLVLKHPDGHLEPRIIGSVHEYLFAPDDPAAVLTRLAAPATRIVSLTVTEGGYNIDRTTNAFDVAAPAIRTDIAALTSGGAPTTVFGYLTAGLAARRAAGLPPFTVMSCDNLPGNGDIARQAVVTLTRLIDPELAGWIEREVAFPNGMVDRITPTTTDADRALVADRFGLADAWPVMAEPFTQWVLEDEFPLGRPPLEQVGVQVVGDVRPYELIKLRLLNAGHQALAYSGLLRGYRYAHEAMADPLVAAVVARYMAEARVTLEPVPDVDIDEYIAELAVRFGNPEIADTLARLATEGSDRMPKFVLPAVRARLASGLPTPWGAAVVAMWKRCYEAGQGERIEFIDPFANELRHRANNADDLDFLRATTIFGDLADQPTFVAGYRSALALLRAGSVGAVTAALR